MESYSTLGNHDYNFESYLSENIQRTSSNNNESISFKDPYIKRKKSLNIFINGLINNYNPPQNSSPIDIENELNKPSIIDNNLNGKKGSKVKSKSKKNSFGQSERDQKFHNQSENTLSEKSNLSDSRERKEQKGSKRKKRKEFNESNSSKDQEKSTERKNKQKDPKAPKESNEEKGDESKEKKEGKKGSKPQKLIKGRHRIKKEIEGGTLSKGFDELKRERSLDVSESLSGDFSVGEVSKLRVGLKNKYLIRHIKLKYYAKSCCNLKSKRIESIRKERKLNSFKTERVFEERQNTFMDNSTMLMMKDLELTGKDHKTIGELVEKQDKKKKQGKKKKKEENKSPGDNAQSDRDESPENRRTSQKSNQKKKKSKEKKKPEREDDKESELTRKITAKNYFRRVESIGKEGNKKTKTPSPMKKSTEKPKKDGRKKSPEKEKEMPVKTKKQKQMRNRSSQETEKSPKDRTSMIVSNKKKKLSVKKKNKRSSENNGEFKTRQSSISSPRNEPYPMEAKKISRIRINSLSKPSSKKNSILDEEKKKKSSLAKINEKKKKLGQSSSYSKYEEKYNMNNSFHTDKGKTLNQIFSNQRNPKTQIRQKQRLIKNKKTISQVKSPKNAKENNFEPSGSRLTRTLSKNKTFTKFTIHPKKEMSIRNSKSIFDGLLSERQSKNDNDNNKRELTEGPLMKSSLSFAQSIPKTSKSQQSLLNNKNIFWKTSRSEREKERIRSLRINKKKRSSSTPYNEEGSNYNNTSFNGLLCSVDKTRKRMKHRKNMSGISQDYLDKKKQFFMELMRDPSNPYSLFWTDKILHKNYGLNVISKGTINLVPNLVGGKKIGETKSQKNTTELSLYDNMNISSVTKNNIYRLGSAKESYASINKFPGIDRSKLAKYPSIFKYFS